MFSNVYGLQVVPLTDGHCDDMHVKLFVVTDEALICSHDKELIPQSSGNGTAGYISQRLPKLTKNNNVFRNWDFKTMMLIFIVVLFR